MFSPVLCHGYGQSKAHRAAPAGTGSAVRIGGTRKSVCSQLMEIVQVAAAGLQ